VSTELNNLDYKNGLIQTRLDSFEKSQCYQTLVAGVGFEPTTFRLPVNKYNT